MSEQQTIEVALFPIPGVVAFPGTVLPLHVFEPRYRRLVRDCIRAQRPLGVCHVRKLIHEPKRPQTLQEVLGSNQATYQPRETFSAGRCLIREQTDDGRLLIEVAMSQRLSLVEELQSLPYRIVSCVELPDDADGDADPQAALLQALINERLIALLTPDYPEVVERLQDPAWVGLAPGDFSFRIFQFLRLETDLMQAILESRRPADRLEMLWDQLRRGG